MGATYEEAFLNDARSLTGKRTRNRPTRLIEEDNESCNVTELLTTEIDEPRTISEAWNGEHSIHWQEATDDEYSSLISNNTWELVPLPKSKMAVGCRRIFKVKRKADGSRDRYKAHLVAQGFTQEQGIDYQEVFSPVVRYTAIKSLLALGNALDLEIHQMDVKTAFLQYELDSEIYMKQPPGYADKNKPNYVCKLRKSIYGLNQAARCWNTAINKHLLQNDYIRSNADSCLYSKSIKKEDGQIVFAILTIYVDDILILSNNVTLLNKEKE